MHMTLCLPVRKGDEYDKKNSNYAYKLLGTTSHRCRSRNALQSLNATSSVRWETKFTTNCEERKCETRCRLDCTKIVGGGPGLKQILTKIGVR